MVEMSNRLDTLKTMAEQDPRNTFVLYGLAMEYINAGELPQAVEEFNRVLKVNPDYGAAYFHAGQTLEKLERTEDAAAMYRRGIEATIRSGDSHTRSELQAALDILGH